MYQYELNDWLFFIESYNTYQAPNVHFDIHQFVHFSSRSRSSAASKLVRHAGILF